MIRDFDIFFNVCGVIDYLQQFNTLMSVLENKKIKELLYVQ